MKTNVFILGTGFSASAGVPTMDNFVQKARDYYFKNLIAPKTKEEQENRSGFDEVEKYLARISSVRNYLDVNLHNIENLYSLVDMENKIKDEHKELLKAIKCYIWKTIEYCTPNTTNKEGVLNKYLSFLGLLYSYRATDKRNKRENIIMTFNYDLVLENTIMVRCNDGNWLTFSYPGYDPNTMKLCDSNFKQDKSGCPYGCFAPDFSNGVVKIIKLHGSINWFLKSNEADGPIIIPPSWRKGETDIIDKTWRYAYESLQKATDIYFIGYSLPETDTYFKNLLAISLSGSQNLERVVVINSDNSGRAEKRYKDLIDRNFEKYFDYQAYSFEALEKWQGLINKHW